MTHDLTSMGQVDKRSTTQQNCLFVLLGGLLIGLAASLPLAVVWPYPTPPPETFCVSGGEQTRLGGMIFPFHCPPAFMFVQPLVWGSFLAAGALFGLLAYKLTGHDSQPLVVTVGGLSFLIASFVGSQVVDRLGRTLVEPLSKVPILFSSSIEPEFSIMSFGVSLTFALAIGLALRTRGLLWRALASATITGIIYYLLAWILFGHANMLFTHDATTPPLADSLPELWRPTGPFMKTTLISNLIAGTIGGAATLYLITTGARDNRTPGPGKQSNGHER